MPISWSVICQFLLIWSSDWLSFFAQVPLVMTMPWLILLTITWYWYCSWVLNMQPYQSIILSTLLQYRIFTIKIWDAIKIHIKVLRKVDEALILHSPLYVSTEWVTGYSKLTKLMIYCKGGGKNFINNFGHTLIVWLFRTYNPNFALLVPHVVFHSGKARHQLYL